MKEYIKPELNLISLVADESITDDLVEGTPGLSGVPEGWE